LWETAPASSFAFERDPDPDRFGGFDPDAGPPRGEIRRDPPGQGRPAQLAGGGQVANTLSPVNLDEMIRKLSAIGDDVKKFSDSLSATFGTEEGKKALGDILRDVQATTASLRTVVTGNEQRFERIVANIDRLSADLSDISSANKQDVRATIANLRAFSDTLKSETPELVRKLEEMSERVSGVVGTTGRT